MFDLGAALFERVAPSLGRVLINLNVCFVRRCRPTATWPQLRLFLGQKRGVRRGAALPGPPGISRGFTGMRPSRCILLRASLRARRMASAFSLAFLSDGFS